MEKPIRARLLVWARGIETWIETLSERADQGDREAERALAKLRDALETCSRLFNDGPELREDEFLALHEGLQILLEAAEGRRDYPIHLLHSIGERVAKDCKRLGIRPPDISSLDEQL